VRQIRFTKQGFESLKKEQADLLHKRTFAVDELQKARELGDLSENGFYKAARAKLSAIDARLRRISSLLKLATVIDSNDANVVGIGNTVKVTDGKREVFYKIVGDMEANPVEGKISLLSPIGKTLAGKRFGDQILIVTPSGNITYRIISIF
jgi:transcription elongation factor GreA